MSIIIACDFSTAYLLRVSDQYIGSYKVLEKVGVGGMAKVYLAVHRDVPNLKVVLKILTDPRLVERFRHEADKLALLGGHSHICQIKHFFNHGDDIVIAMEYIDGVTLDEIIKEKKKLSVKESLRIINDVLATLEFAHQKGIYHRDIKPSNIMIDSKGQVKVIDFGIAKAETDPDLTVAGGSCGTPTYMAPEQFTPSGHINYALADIYAVGTMLYNMLTGDLPFKGEDQFALRDAKLFTEPVKPRELNHEIPVPLEKIILKAIDKNPEGRFATTSQMQKAIGVLVREIGISGRIEDAGPVIPRKSAGKKGPALKVASVFAVLAVCVVAVYLVFIRGGSKDTPASPVLFQPETNVVINTNRPSFAWEPTAGEGGTYTLEYSDDSMFLSPQVVSGLTVASYTPAEDLAEGACFWRVQAIDRDGNSSGLSTVSSFTIEIAPEATEGIITVAVQPRGDIYIDGDLVGKDEEQALVTLDTGRHIIRVENQGSVQKVMVDTILLAENGNETSNFRFTFPSSQPKQALTSIRVGSKPLNGALVYIDGQLQDRRTPNTYEVTSGRHVIKAVLTLAGKQLERTDTVSVVTGNANKLIFDFEN